MQARWTISQQTFLPSPPFPSTGVLPFSSSSHTALHTLLQQPLTKILPLLIPPLLEIGTPRELVDKFHSSCEFLFALPITEWWKYCCLLSCLSWHPTPSFSQAFSVSHCLNIQLCFKSTSWCSSFVVVYLRCCSMFMECSFTGKIPWPKTSKGTTHLGLFSNALEKLWLSGKVGFLSLDIRPLWSVSVGQQNIAKLKLHLTCEEGLSPLCFPIIFASCSIRFWQASAVLSYKNMKLRQNWVLKEVSRPWCCGGLWPQARIHCIPYKCSGLAWM